MNERHQPVAFAERNAEGYRCLLYVEVALRELAKHELRRHHGEKWQKRIPGRYLQKIRNDQKDEAMQASFGFRKLGPLYYLTFGELVDLSSQKPIVNRLKDVLGQQGPELLRESVPSRNAVAHCRDLTENALATVRALKMRMVTGLTANDLVGLLQEPDIGLYPEEARKSLAGWLRRARSALCKLRTLSAEQEDYEMASSQYWWSSSELVPARKPPCGRRPATNPPYLGRDSHHGSCRDSGAWRPAGSDRQEISPEVRLPRMGKPSRLSTGRSTA